MNSLVKRYLELIINKYSFTVVISAASIWVLSQLIFPYVKVGILILLSSDHSLLSTLIFSPIFTTVYFIIAYKGIKSLGQSLTEKFSIKMSSIKFVTLSLLLTIFLTGFSHYIVFITHELYPNIFPTENSNPVFKYLDSNFAKFLFVTIVLIPAAIYEEVFFRALCFDGLIVKYNLIITILLNNIIFLCFHPFPEYLAVNILWNTLICLIYYRWKSLLMVILIHWLGNVLNVFHWWDWF